MVEQRKFDYIQLLFLVPGHTKFSSDRLFSSIAHIYNKSDVFNTDELQSLCSSHVVEDGSAILFGGHLLTESMEMFLEYVNYMI